MSSKRQRVGQDDFSSSPVSTRPRRGTASKPAPAQATIEEPRSGSIRLTVKADPRKLKEATQGPAKGSIKVNLREPLDGGEIVRGARSTRKKAIIESEPEDEDDDENEEEEVDEEDEELEGEEGEEDDEEDAEGSEDEEDAEGEDDEEVEEEVEDEDEDAEGDDSEDVEMDDAPPIEPKSKVTIATIPKSRFTAPKPQVTITPAKPLLSVEDKEMGMDEDEDEELSELDEDEDLEGGELGEEDEEDMDDEEDISRSQTPDVSKLTRRQRAEAQGLMALSNEAQKKKHFTADEISLRRQEMARRRKALSIKRNDEEKQDTINRLLKRQASKRQRKADIEADRIAEEGEDVQIKANKVYSRYIMNSRGVMMAVPQEWTEGNFIAGGLFGKEASRATAKPWTGRMVEVVD